ncbi:phosphomannose isomerase type II C-terminal cupin domain [Taibaiella helva]|uniref:phosphomannose isomerase type II C-terminal cupin domain n=1 Tax=Taibaiella helva TaxID=2301235 RepID=UPI000E586871|nr:phosphomannose isomerase type II C-terminal cupin domain [Taibaiella helva]
MEHDVRPWGEYWVLEDKDSHKVKRIEVKPGGRLSYQYHHHRSEVWTIISGIATVTIEGEQKKHGPGEVVKIEVMAKHRVANEEQEPLVIIEVQLGTYFGEDDIIRLDDDYARVDLDNK